ncbi:hypothetical protein IPA_03810 [Ignicoccus pacificus DSM 13166]|uniref:Major facilitator superfamily (MFS) profile domain-containing protein n=1 Tax=Ignicoccus pacificus DSM 13166 TaxID=940294 RepID=A0A977KB03_9CREN|nr:hypothetical protein IPA_03810 [Ignicoccus pacificus DSM 13166]
MWKRFVLLSLIISITFAASNVALPYFMLYLKGSLHQIVAKFLPAEKVVVEVGTLTSAYMATRVIVAFSSGFIAERTGRKRALMSGLILYLISGIGMIFSNSFLQVLLWRALQGVASALVWPIAESLLVDLFPESKTKALMFYVMAMNLGFIFGPVLGGAVLQAAASLPLDVAVRTPFVLLPIGAILGIIMMIKVPEVIHKSKKLRELSAKIMGALYVFFLNGFVNGIAGGMMMSVLLIYIMQYITSVPMELASILAISGIVGMLLAVPLTKKMDEIGFQRRFQILVWTGAIHKIALMAMMLAKGYASMVLVLTVFNFATSVAMPLMRSVQSDLIPKELTAKVFGIQQSTFNFGMIIGPLFGSILYKWFVDNGMDGGWVFVIAGLIGLVGIVALALVDREILHKEIEAMRSS